MAAKNTNIESKFWDIIGKSVLIHSRSPDVYQLKTKRGKIGTLTRVTVGERNSSKPNKTILLVGETGAGKSTLINTLFNYTIGVKCEDEVWFQIVEEEKRSQTKSQTSDVIVYEIFGFEDETLNCSLTIIDTPGFGDTRGTEYDDIVRQRLFELFQSNDGICEVHAVGLVMKATDNRVTDRLEYICDAMMSLFGHDLKEIIVTLMTHSDGKTPKNALHALEMANIKCAKDEHNQPMHFLFDNSEYEGHKEEKEMTGIKEFTNFVENAAPRKVLITEEVLKEQIRLTACIENLHEKIELIELKQTEIMQTQEALEKHQEKMKKNENFTVEVDEVYKDKESINGGMWLLFFYQGAVTCTVCEENCHYPGCTMSWYPKHCEVIKGGHCIVCTKKCPPSAHVKETWRYVTKTRKVQKTKEEMKEKFEKNKTKHENKCSLLENLTKEMIQLTAEKKQFLDESYQHVVRLEQIALKADSLSTYIHLDFLIEKMKGKGDTKKVKKLEEMRSRVDEGTRAALRYKHMEKKK